MRILITTGIYPPKIGGPAQYAKNLKDAFEKMGHVVNVKTYGMEDRLPTGIRHLFFFLKIIPQIAKSNAVFILDTFSVGWPAVLACKIFGKKGIIRTGGDFLWEQYVERTKKKILFRDFYQTKMTSFSMKERIIFKITKWTLNNTSKIIFSTEWQRDIFVKAYGLNVADTCIVENYYGPKAASAESFGEPGESNKIFIGSARNLVWKNFNVLERVFGKIKTKHPKVVLFTDSLPYQQFMEKMSKSYAVVLVSLGDISPNMILDAIRLNRPFICTKEVGIFERIKEAGIFIDPLNEREIEMAILNLLTEEGYRRAKEKVRSFNFTHTWNEIASEFIRTLDSTE
ncbi:MAG: glycosyltransferase family 4 protein [Candidatus Zambryskibacteria bacterium]